MNILFAHGKFTLLSSNGSNKVFARQFLRRSFINNLYTSPISSIIDSYGDFVVVGYYTGGRALRNIWVMRIQIRMLNRKLNP